MSTPMAAPQAERTVQALCKGCGNQGLVPDPIDPPLDKLRRAIEQPEWCKCSPKRMGPFVAPPGYMVKYEFDGAREVGREVLSAPDKQAVHDRAQMPAVDYAAAQRRRAVSIQAAKHPREPAGVCSCCRGGAPRGVLIFEGRGKFDPMMSPPHVFYCVGCASRIGAAAQKARALR